ncbi:Uncharacterised protein [Vibrio cholerae]|nr:Uncharacterised protein [Vibrio cholerae]
MLFSSLGDFKISKRCHIRSVLGMRHCPSSILSCSQRRLGLSAQSFSVFLRFSKQPLNSTRLARISNGLVKFMISACDQIHLFI